MKSIRLPSAVVFAASLAGASALPGVCFGQAVAPLVPQGAGFTSKPVLVSPITDLEGKEMVLIAVTLEPGASSPAHTHPGDCYGTVMEGSIELRIDGKAARRLVAGESYATLASPAHQFTNVGDKPVYLLNALIVEKGKPRTVTQPGSLK